jgi:hypothetical protein
MPEGDAALHLASKVQPTPEARVGVAEFPKHILKAESLLTGLK